LKKIGILTFWGVPNYGAWTQAYALNKTINRLVSSEYDVNHIAYLHNKHSNSYYINDIRLKNSFSYSWRTIPHTYEMSDINLENEFFDTIITGSDAIWEFSIDVFGDDSHLIGNDLNTKKLISYAASFGTMCKNDYFKEWVKNGLDKYEHISVRDENSREIVKSLNKSADLVLDPALLWDFENDSTIVKPIYEDYILVYGTNFSEKFIKFSVEFANKKNLKLISAGYINNWCDFNMKLIELRSNEWIGMFAKAKYVITNTFHGLMLSLSYNKQFKFERVEYVKNRSESLIKELNLDMYFDDSADKIKRIFEEDIDYYNVNNKLNFMRNESLNWLKNAIGD